MSLNTKIKIHRSIALSATCLAMSLLWAPLTQARITKLTIDPVRSESPTFNGQVFDVGQYELVRGTVKGEIDPADRRNAVITDIEYAPLNANGKVEYTATFSMLKPIDMSKASGVLVYGIPNRGRTALGYGNIDETADMPAGDGFDENPGHVYLDSGWQGDLGFDLDRETVDVPIAKYPDGSSISSPIFNRFVQPSGNTASIPGMGRTLVSLDTSQATLTTIAHENNLGEQTGVVELPSDAWAFADCRVTPFPGDPDPTRICVRDDFDSNLIYQLVWKAKDPYVLGVGMAAMRDVVAFFRRAAHDDEGNPNPIAGTTKWVLGFGRSQSGRFQKNFILLGFNEDEDGKIVWDGAQPIIAGQMGQFNVRFSNQGNIANLYEPGAEGPLWWGNYNDKQRGRGVTGLLQRCRKTHTCPKVFDDFGGPEIWYSRGSVSITGTAGKRDIPLPGNIRRYYHAGTPHGGGVGGFEVNQPEQNGRVLARNPNPQTETRRALFVALVDWISKNKQPPDSAYPSYTDGSMVDDTAAAMGWPDIPGQPTPDGVMNVLFDYDYGPDFNYNNQSGVMTNVVPPIKQIIRTPAGRVDEDGNEVAGVKSVLFQAPLGTYTPWNQEADGPRQGTEPSLAAGYIPFAMTKAERLASGDPRLSIEERYGSQEGYNCVVEQAAAREVKKRLLLQVDADRLIAQAAASNILPSDPNNPIAKNLCKGDKDKGKGKGKGKHRGS